MLAKLLSDVIFITFLIFSEITQMCVTAIANLQQSSLKDGSNRSLFSKDKEIIPYIEYHWEALTTTSRRVTQSWHATVYKALHKDLHTVFAAEENQIEGHIYGLTSTDLTQIKPNYEAMIRGGTLRITDMGIQHGNKQKKNKLKQFFFLKKCLKKSSEMFRKIYLFQLQSIGD